MWNLESYTKFSRDLSVIVGHTSDTHTYTHSHAYTHGDSEGGSGWLVGTHTVSGFVPPLVFILDHLTCFVFVVCVSLWEAAVLSCGTRPVDARGPVSSCFVASLDLVASEWTGNDLVLAHASCPVLVFFKSICGGSFSCRL